MKLGILTAFRNEHKNYIKSCEKLNIDYQLIDIIADNWLDEIMKSDCDGFLCRTPSKFQERKNMFDERLYIINSMIGKPIYPSYNELLVHENKKMMYYFMKLNNLPHVETHVFYKKEEYYEFIEKATFPLVFKTNIGSTSKGVEIIKNKTKAKSIGKKVFGMLNSKLAKGYTPQTTGKIIPIRAKGLLQRHFIILQKFEEIKWEWRIIKIGKSYFGHKKLLKGNFASGSGSVGWDKPPKELLLLAKKINEEHDFHSLSLDIFETKKDEFLINEIQSIFGSYDDSQMYIDGKPGRFIFKNGDFIFEEGYFNQFGSYLLRVKHFLEILKGDYK